MDNELVYSADATYQKAQYDACAKRLLGQKIILAHILIRVVDEFKGMDAETVASLIEGEPYISQVPVEPGLTNKEMVDSGTGERIVGLNTESFEIDEGKVYFDIIFYVRMRDGLAKMIINLEAQKNEPTKYHILNRAIFYTARLVSSQKEREFTGSDYNEIRTVYSYFYIFKSPAQMICHFFQFCFFIWYVCKNKFFCARLAIRLRQSCSHMACCTGYHNRFTFKFYFQFLHPCLNLNSLTVP